MPASTCRKLKTGASSWTLTGTQTATAPWTVNQGALFVDGSIASSDLITVDRSAELHVGTTVIDAGGSLVPDPVGTPGTMTVAGSLVFQFGAFYVQANPTTASSTNVVVGIAWLAGTVVAIFAPGTYMDHSYTILTAAGGRLSLCDPGRP